MVRRFDPEAGKSLLKDIMDRNTIKFAEEKQKVRSSLYASDFGQCQRKVWYQFFPERFPSESFEPRVLRIFHNGNSVHERLGTYLKLSPELDFHDEVDVPRDDLDVHGRCDGICAVDDRAVVVEFKSINSKYVYSPKDEHVGQLSWYLGMFRKLRFDLREDFAVPDGEVVGEADLNGVVSLSGRTVDELNHVEKWLLFTQGELRGELIYESKQDQHLYHFSVDYSDSEFQKVRLWFEQLAHYIKEKKRPEVNWDKSRFPCKWNGGKCPYYDVCWKNDL